MYDIGKIGKTCGLRTALLMYIIIYVCNLCLLAFLNCLFPPVIEVKLEKNQQPAEQPAEGGCAC